jgi:hypothetical protein
MLHKNYIRKCSLGKKYTGRESQGACRQDEQTGSKPPVVSNSDSGYTSNETYLMKLLEDDPKCGPKHVAVIE